MDDPDRESVLEAVTPEELFGEAVADPRALRRAYATLAKRYKADPEVFTHVRTLYEAARDGVPLRPTVAPAPDPETDPSDGPDDDAAGPHGRLAGDDRHPADILHEAMQEADLQRAYDVIATRHRDLIRDAPGLLEHVVHVLIEGVGSRLSESPLDVLEAVIDDPTWDLPPDLVLGWRVRLRQSRALWQVPDEPAPQRLVDALRRTWSAPAHLAAPIWLDLAEYFREQDTDLDALFATLERDHPTVLGLVRIVERRMLTLAETHPAELPEARMDRFHEQYQPSSECMEHWWLERYQRANSGVARGLQAMGYAAGALLFLANPIYGMLLWFTVYWIARSMQPTEQAAEVHFDQVHARSTKGLMGLCWETGTFPRELAARVYGGAVPMRDRPAFLPTHPLYRLDRRDANLLQAIGPRHVERLEGIAQRIEAARAAAADAESEEAG